MSWGERESERLGVTLFLTWNCTEPRQLVWFLAQRTPFRSYKSVPIFNKGTQNSLFGVLAKGEEQHWTGHQANGGAEAWNVGLCSAMVWLCGLGAAA